MARMMILEKNFENLIQKFNVKITEELSYESIVGSKKYDLQILRSIDCLYYDIISIIINI